MAFARVQGNSGYNSATGSSIAVTISAVGSGNAICGFASWDTGTANAVCTSVDDDKGNTYNLETAVDDSPTGRVVAFSRTNITNAPTVITAHFNLSPDFRAILVDEFSGGSTASSDERDGTAHGGLHQASPGTGTDAITSGTFTTAVNGDLLWGCSEGGNTTAVASNGTSFSTGTQHTTDYAKQTEFRTQATAGAGTAATFTQGTDTNRITFLIAIKPQAGGAQPSGSSDYYAVASPKQGLINSAQPHLLAYESNPSPRSFTRPSGESAFYDVDPYPRQRFRDQHDAYATRFVQQVPPPGSGGFSWHYDRAVYPQLRFRDQHETYPPRGLVPSPVTPVGWTTPYESRLWNTWRRPRPELLIYDGQAISSFTFTQAPSGAVAFFDFDKYPALQFRHQHESYPARGLIPTAATPQGWTAFYDVEAAQKSKAALADHESAEFSFFPPRPLWTNYYDVEVIKGRARDYSDAPTPPAQAAAFTWTDFYDIERIKPGQPQQHETYPARGLVPTATTPQGFTAPFDLARVLSFPVKLQQHDGYQHFNPPAVVSLGPLGWSMYWDKGRKPLLPDRMPFLFEQLYQTPTATTPQGWTHLLDTARVKVFPVHLQQYDALGRLSFPTPFIGVTFERFDALIIRPRPSPYSVVDRQPAVVVPPSAYALFPELFKRPRPFPYLIWPEQRVAVLNTPTGAGGPTYFYDRRLAVMHRPIAEVVPYDGRGLPFVVVNIIVHRPGKGGLLTPVLLAATKGQPTLTGIRATPTLSGEVED